MFPERDRHRLLPTGLWISSTSHARTEIFPAIGQREMFVFLRLYFSWRGLVMCCADPFFGKRLDKPPPRPECAAITDGNAIGEAAWQNEGAWVAEGNSYVLIN